MTAILNKAQQNYNVAQLRKNTWNELKHLANKISRCHAGSQQCIIFKKEIAHNIKDLEVIEKYFAFPGTEGVNEISGMLKRDELAAFRNKVSELVTILISAAYRQDLALIDESANLDLEEIEDDEVIAKKQKYFEVLFVDNISDKEMNGIKNRLKKLRNPEDEFYYKLVHVTTFEDALMAMIFNPSIQACIIRYGLPYKSKHTKGLLKPFIGNIQNLKLEGLDRYERGPMLGNIIKNFRPEVDLYFGTDDSPAGIKDSTLKNFKRIFYRKEDIQELHLTVMLNIKERFNTPFFSALVKYSQRPTGVFHAMPISRGNSVFKSRWINDFGEFYGRNLFLAETSATTGGLDSLLQPTGPLKVAQEMAAKAFGAQHTFFATNGTSTSNKIVLQALVEPGDLVLIDRDCHKSHHYGMVLSGALPVYLDSYAIEKYSMYGAVPLSTIKRKLINLKKAGRLDRVKMLLLTNCTFDGLVYNVEKFMEKCLL